jgi:hypothetical protein
LNSIIVNNLPAKSIGMIVLTLTACSLHLPASADDSKSPTTMTSRFPDKIIGSKTVVGYFQNFFWGDYFYAVVKTDRGNINFMVNPSSPKLRQRDEDCFLVQHQTARLKIQYDTISSYIPEAGGYHSIDVIRKIQTDRTSLAKWHRSISPAMLKRCRQLVDRATKSS